MIPIQRSIPNVHEYTTGFLPFRSNAGAGIMMILVVMTIVEFLWRGGIDLLTVIRLGTASRRFITGRAGTTRTTTHATDATKATAFENR